MVDVVFPQLSVPLDDFHPDIHDFLFIPAVPLRLFAILHDIEQTRLEILKDHHKSVHGPSAHDEVIDQL